MKADEKDLKLLSMMVSKPSISQREIAEELGLTPPAVHNRILRLKEKGILLGTMPKIALDKLGYDLTVLVNIRIKNGKLTEASEALSKDPKVCICYRVTGNYDLVVMAKFHDTKDLDEWTRKLYKNTDFIDRTSTSLVITKDKESLAPSEIK